MEDSFQGKNHYGSILTTFFSLRCGVLLTLLENTPKAGRSQPASSWYAAWWEKCLNPRCRIRLTQLSLPSPTTMFQLPKRRATTGRSNGVNGNGTGGRNGSSSSVAVPDDSPPTTTISSSDYARRCRQLMTLDKDLRELGYVL
jgi:hypothetical protein